MNDDIAQLLVPPDRGAGPEPGAQFLPGGLAVALLMRSGLPREQEAQP
jgi:hypothetical protein